MREAGVGEAQGGGLESLDRNGQVLQLPPMPG